MSINFEVKGQLAKLLATEDLVVEHRYVETAMFNVHTRVLTLPMWKKASEKVFDMLVAHEVGHALFTPDEWDWDTPKQFVNVVEDVRIEKLMKRKYAGLSKTFYYGYNELADEDFFALEGEDISKMNLADRVNLYYKIGNFVDISFKEFDEMPIVRMIGECETFADVLIAAEFLYKFCKKQQESKTENIDDYSQEVSAGSDSGNSDSEVKTGSEDTTIDSDTSDESSEDSETHNIPNDHKSSSSGKMSQDLDVKTMENLQDSISELIGDYGADNSHIQTTYLEIPKLNMDSVITSNQDIHEYCEDFWKPFNDSYESGCFEFVDAEYKKFKKSAQKEVNYLVKEFECKKAADSYARATTARTGILDCTKLHTYKYNEDLFKKVTTLADGKNHGLIFVLDWSGSMCNVMLDTIKQLYNLVWFCNKVSIPFEVYAFTNEWNGLTYDQNGNAKYPQPHYEKKENLLHISDNFNMMNILSSKVSNKKLEQQLLNVFRIAFGFKRYVDYSLPPRLSLSGTPLNEAFVALNQIIPDFQSLNKLQKVQCIVLTDGEASPLNRHVEVERGYDNSKKYIGTARMHRNCYIRDRKLGTTYNILNYHYNDCAYVSFSNCLLQQLKDKFPTTNFIGIRILERDSGSFIRLHTDSWEKVELLKTIWKKERCIVLKDCGYQRYFGLSGSDLSNNTDFEVEDHASKVKIKSAFIKSLKSKKMNKKILNEFIDLVV